MIRIWGDFNNRDGDWIILDTVGSKKDLRRYAKQLREGLRVVVHDDSYEAEGILEWKGGVWRARILWDTGRNMNQEE
jgi:hypothetical protein